MNNPLECLDNDDAGRAYGMPGQVQPVVVPTVADVHRRTAELLWTPEGAGLATVGEIRHRLISEFGRDLFNAAAKDALGHNTSISGGGTPSV